MSSDVRTAAGVLPRPAARAFHWVSAGREILVLLGLFLGYKLGRMLTLFDPHLAFTNAHRVWGLERALHLPRELGAQHALLGEPGAIGFANGYYMFVHLPATAACLIWVYARAPGIYPALRAGLLGMTGLALVLHLTFPLAPPRMLGELGFVDTGAVYGPSVYGPPEASGMLNQYAAMPSMHVGWAVLVAAAMVASSTSRWRWLFVAHPAITTVAVVGSANHYWLDGIVACALLGASLAVWRRHRAYEWDAMTRPQRGSASSPAVAASGATPSSRSSTCAQRR